MTSFGSRADILSQREPHQAELLEFVLSQCVAQGEDELGAEKLPDHLALRYGTPADAMRTLGGVAKVRLAFRGFQEAVLAQRRRAQMRPDAAQP